MYFICSIFADQYCTQVYDRVCLTLFFFKQTTSIENPSFTRNLYFDLSSVHRREQ